jgi:arylformamidase
MREFRRRSFLIGATALPVIAQSASRGPKVFLDYNQGELDRAYDQDAWADLEPVKARMRQRRTAALKYLRAPKKVPYGTAAVEELALYTTAAPKAPTAIYIHGGAWQTSTDNSSPVIAETFVRAGAHFVVPSFTAVQDANKSLFVMAEQVRRAIAWTWKNADGFGGDQRKIYLLGHSSGAHLSGSALTANWEQEHGIPPTFLSGALLASGMYDLEGPSLSSRSNYVNFDAKTLDLLSPARHIESLRTPLNLAYGALETPEFQRQSRDFAAALTKAGKKVELIVAEGHNHNEMLESLANPYGVLGRAALLMMGLS